MQMQQALKARDAIRLSVLRGLLSEFTNDLVAQKRKPDGQLSDEEVLVVIGRAAKQRQDSIEQFTKGRRSDLADKEKAELEILQTYLPEQLSRDEIEKIVKAKKDELGIADKSDIGKLMGAVMSELKGKADGNIVKEVVTSFFE